ncbi:MAG TPA: hypothetical protein VF755_09905 [Catenuloplanes sp.]
MRGVALLTLLAVAVLVPAWTGWRLRRGTERWTGLAEQFVWSRLGQPASPELIAQVAPRLARRQRAIAAGTAVGALLGAGVIAVAEPVASAGYLLVLTAVLLGPVVLAGPVSQLTERRPSHSGPRVATVTPGGIQDHIHPAYRWWALGLTVASVLGVVAYQLAMRTGIRVSDGSYPNSAVEYLVIAASAGTPVLLVGNELLMRVLVRRRRTAGDRAQALTNGILLDVALRDCMRLPLAGAGATATAWALSWSAILNGTAGLVLAVLALANVVALAGLVGRAMPGRPGTARSTTVLAGARS